MNIIIGLTGPKGAGKDTAASGVDGTVVKFAGPLKDMLRAGFGLTEEEVEGSLKEAPLARLGLDVSPRHLMQTLGTEWGRKWVDRDIWLILAAARIESTPGIVLVTDVRFPNEADYIRRVGHLVHVVPRVASGDDGHASEVPLDEDADDLTLWNSGTADELRRRFARMVERLMR